MFVTRVLKPAMWVSLSPRSRLHCGSSPGIQRALVASCLVKGNNVAAETLRSVLAFLRLVSARTQRSLQRQFEEVGDRRRNPGRPRLRWEEVIEMDVRPKNENHHGQQFNRKSGWKTENCGENWWRDRRKKTLKKRSQKKMKKGVRRQAWPAGSVRPKAQDIGGNLPPLTRLYSWKRGQIHLYNSLSNICGFLTGIPVLFELRVVDAYACTRTNSTSTSPNVYHGELKPVIVRNVLCVLGVVDFLSTEISTSKQKKFSLVTFVDTPGLVDGDMQYPYDVNETIMWLGKMADLVFVFFDPIGQALCKRTLNLVERLNTAHTEKMRFYLSKADDAGNESDRQRVMMQIVQELCKRPGLNRTGFDMPTIYIPDLNKQTRCVNQIDGVCESVEHTINQTIQNTLNTLERDCESISQLITRRVIQDVADRNYNFKTSGRAMFLGGLGAILPFLLVTYLLVTNLSNSFLDSILGERATDSLIAFLSPVGMLWSVIPERHQWTFVLFMIVVSTGLFALTKWSLGLRDTLSRKQKRSFETMIDHIENVVKIRKQQLYREYLEQSVGDHDLL